MIIQREYIYTRANPPRGWPADGRPQNPSGFWFDEVDELDETVETDKKERLASQQPKAGKRKKVKNQKKNLEKNLKNFIH